MKPLFTKGVSLEYRLVAFVLLAVLVMFADRRYDYLDRFRFTVAYLSTPIYWVADIPTRVSLWIDDVFVSQRDLIEENAQLRQELLFAQRELQLLAGLASENSRLRDLQAASQTVQGRAVTAEIINVSNDPGARRVLINRGAHNGVFEGQAVLDAHGLMGQVVEVLPFTSWVLLITDSRHGTPVQVNRNGERAIARGSRSDVAGLELEFVPDTADIVVGDLLVSSGLGQRFPKDYPVAEVTSVVHDPGQAFAVIRARPLAQMDRTRHVMLVIPDDEVISSVPVPDDFLGAGPGELPVTEEVSEPTVSTNAGNDIEAERDTVPDDNALLVRDADEQETDMPTAGQQSADTEAAVTDSVNTEGTETAVESAEADETVMPEEDGPGPGEDLP
ncbi:rod shape-determining protein MreC [Pseudohongiella sp. SYSU M77423]|nr:rod shape-determining protein MreC [Pseudohongiella sp. SYSU M77423]MDH7942412.1 rod shape-determining protein MreC [Pseudohongiella sp. SYSU M77423]